MATYYLLWLFIAAVIYWMALMGFVRDEALLPRFEQEQLDREASQKELPTSEPTENKENGSSYFEEMISLIEEKKIFTNPNLSLTSLAAEVGISKSYLSKIINQHAEKNFYQFINEYRVTYFKELCKEDDAALYSLTGLAEKAGFKSKSTFHSSFKRIEGVTPSEYVNSIKKN